MDALEGSNDFRANVLTCQGGGLALQKNPTDASDGIEAKRLRLRTFVNAGAREIAAAFLEKANWLTALDNVVWDSGWLLSDSSILGKALHTLIGYTDQPTAMQLMVYLAILAATFVLMRLYGAPVKAALPARG